MNLNIRPYQTEDDYWRIRQFLREVFLLNDRKEYCWQPYRFDYWRWHGVENIGDGPLEKTVFLWETPQGELKAMLNAEGRGNAFLQIHPAYQNTDLLEEMMGIAEEELTLQTGGQRRLTVWTHSNETMLKEILARRGFRKGDGWCEYQRRRPLTLPIDPKPAPEGFIVRSLGDVRDLPARGWASWRGFHTDEPLEGYGGWEWLLNVQRCPLYRRDLDLVAVAPSGEVGAFCTVWFDDVTRTGAFEPVATAGEYRRLGLASAVMAEGLRRMKHLGATMATVGSYTPHAHALYDSMGFTDYLLAEPWEKIGE